MTDAAPDMAHMHGFRNIRAVFRGLTPNHAHLRDRLKFLWGLTLALDLVFSLLAWALESRDPDTDIHNYGDALFWTTTQLLTISSSYANPVTGWGQALDVVMEFLGITIITAQAGSLGSFLYRLSMERNPDPHHVMPEPPADPVASNTSSTSQTTTEAGA